MEKRLEQLRARRAAAVAAIEALTKDLDAITDLVASEERADLNETEDAEYRAKFAEAKAERTKVDELDEQIADLESEIKRAGRQDAKVVEIAKATAKVEVTKEARTYEKGNGVSYVQDLMRRHFRLEDEDTTERLRRHATEVRTDKEYRDLNRTDGTGGWKEMATVA